MKIYKFNHAYNSKRYIPIIKGLLIKELNDTVHLTSGIEVSIAINNKICIDLCEQGETLYFSLRSKYHYCHKECIESILVHPSPIGKVGCHFFKGFDPYQNEEI